MARTGSLIGVLGLMLGFLVWRQDPGIVAGFTREHAVLERISAGIWFVAAAWCIVVGSRDAKWRLDWLLGAIILALLGSRELDIHAWLTGWSLDDFHKYWDCRIPLGERLMVVGFFLAPSLAVGVLFTLRMWRVFRPAFRSRAAWTRDAMAWLLVAGITLAVDKLYRIWPALHAQPTRDLLKTLEESLELGLGIYVILFLWPLWRQVLIPRNPRSAPPK